MRIFEIYKILFTLLLVINIKYGKAQSPLNDSNWVLQTSLSDEFSGTNLSSNWGVVDFWHNGTTPIYYGNSTPSQKWSDELDCCTSGQERWAWNKNSSNNTIPDRVALGADGALNVLKLRVDSAIGPPFDNWPNSGNFTFANSFYTGCVKTINGSSPDYTAYSYGYLEISAKLPAGKIVNGVNYAAKIWPAFWMYHQEFVSGCLTVHDEIDIIDPGTLYANSNTKSYGGAINREDGNCSANQRFNYQYTDASSLSSSYHKYGVEWNTDRAIFYFDDVPVGETHDASILNMHAMRVVLGLQIDIYLTFANDSIFYYNTDGKSWNRTAQYLNVDYFHYYKLNTTGCSNNVTLLTNSDLASYSWGVKSNITFGNGSNTISLNSGDKKVFRAVNTITINGELTVPAGAEFTVEPTPCN